MCQKIYFATKYSKENLEVKDSSGFYVNKVKESSEYLRSILKSEDIYEVGSFMGCTCGLVIDDDLKEDNYEKRLDNVLAFKAYLRENFDIVSEVVTLFDYLYTSREEFPQGFLDISEEKHLKFFELENDSIYQLILPEG